MKNVYLTELLNRKPLYVFALEDEAQGYFSDVSRLFTGVGKVNATYALTQKLTDTKPDIIVNLGSAGSAHFARGTVVNGTQFVQRDMDVTALNFPKYETPFSKEPRPKGLVAPNFPEAICGTGDNFCTDHAPHDYTMVEMEAYALALVAMREQIPFLCLKYISDGADGKAAEDWTLTLQHAAKALRASVDSLKNG